MAILIDADVLLHAERGHFDLEAWLRRYPHQEFKLASITVAELWRGVERAPGAHRAKRRQFLEHLLEVFELIPYTRETAIEHARLWAELESMSHLIGAYDMILAATALQNGGTLATFTRRHFGAIKGLNLLKPE
jgi:tRNA(fMet)-specific endonuclease VapC